MPRRKKGAATPPPFTEDPEVLAAVAADRDLETGGDAPLARNKRRGDRAGQREAAPRVQEPGAVAPPPIGGEVTFPIEAIAAVHGELWNALAKRLRSRWHLSEAGALEMAKSGEIMMRQYLGPFLAEHAALAAYLMTQAAALLALLALREEPTPKPAPLPDSGLARAATQPAA